MPITQIVWLALLVLFLVLEAATTVLVSIWFCAGSLLALGVSLIWPEAIFAQVVVFLLGSAAMLLALRPIAKKLVGNRRIATNADANIGKLGQVVTEIQPGVPGRVKVAGLEWAAQSTEVLQVGAWCRVMAIEGVKLTVVPEKPPV